MKSKTVIISLAVVVAVINFGACSAKRNLPKLAEIQSVPNGLSKFKVASVESSASSDDLKTFVPSLEKKACEGVKVSNVFKKANDKVTKSSQVLIKLEIIKREAAGKLAHLSSMKAETAITVRASFSDLISKKELGVVEIVGTSAKVDDAKLKVAAVDNLSKMDDNLDELALSSVARQLATFIKTKE